MKVLIKSATILDSSSPFHQQCKNLIVSAGKVYITDEEPEADYVLSSDQLIVTTGWADMRADFCDPGYEYKEDLMTGRQAAESAGYTDVAILPNTSPVLQTKNDVKYIHAQNGEHVTSLHVLAAATLGTKGEDFCEYLDLHHAGAIAFTDGKKSIWHPDILLKMLQYLQKFDGLTINFPQDKWLSAFGTVHEGLTSTMLGLKGIPSLSEELIVERDLRLLEHAGGKIHFSCISTEGSVNLIRQAKQQGLQVTCDVASLNLVYTSEAVSNFDSLYKVNPPLRDESDRQALLMGLIDGTIDAICSNHIPQDIDAKNLEFDLADFGALGLQSMLHVLLQISDKIDLNTLIQKVTIGPRKILKLPTQKIDHEAPACLTVISKDMRWALDERALFSKSKNTPYLHGTMQGKVIATFGNGHQYLAAL